MDVDAWSDAHRADWERLEALLRRRRWSVEEADEALVLYRRAATALSVVRSSTPDPALVSRLSSLVARARAAVTGAPTWSWRDPLRFVTEEFPAALAASARWWVTTALCSLVVMVVLGWWVATTPGVAAAISTPEQTRRLVDQEFASYYSSNPAGSFAAQVWTNNALVAATCLVTGVLLLPVLWVLLQNVANVAVVGGILTANGRLDLFLGLIVPHGLLELTAVFVAAGAGLRLGWTWIDPGRETRAQALARQGRTTAGLALGLAGVLLVSGVIEAFVTPSGLPTWARIGLGVLAELGFVAYVLHGRRVLRRRGRPR
ncbi:stage II sporulation protein M [Actinomycetospora sp. TBRC 11914]|uniref:stage II sporulation protein M n=1 Tax=Actinomycetospora sp. TBRC 11914 TaxID=2729387 RepID=UPI00145D9EC5|nr:stage II sporulation protein M [Actinomycetospora sp. TBRC 11914]NMO92785.1 stage II sporulation protein M [Actinomycetospora sp. TBRC 11914]